MVHQPELIIGERAPRVIDGNRPRRLTAVRVALIHRDAAEVVLEDLHGIEHRGRPIADAGIQTTAGSHQQRKAAAGLLIADANIALFVEWHGTLPFPNTPFAAWLLKSWPPPGRPHRGDCYVLTQPRKCLLAASFSTRRKCGGPRRATGVGAARTPVALRGPPHFLRVESLTVPPANPASQQNAITQPPPPPCPASWSRNRWRHGARATGSTVRR